VWQPMDSVPAISVPVAEIGLRQEAKERLYVICQVGGWDSFFTLQAVFSGIVSKPEDHHDPVETSTVLVVVTAGGAAAHSLIRAR